MSVVCCQVEVVTVDPGSKPDQKLCSAERHGKIHETLGCVYTCLTQLCGGIDMYNLLHKDQLHVSALIIGHIQCVRQVYSHSNLL